MTQEEIIRKVLDTVLWTRIASDDNKNILTDALIEALEQESIFDKIRAEIEKKIVKRPRLDFKDSERDRNDAFLEVLDIIDKYKAESEEGAE